MTNDKPSSGVTIGNVTGGIHGSIIAGRDVKDVTITLGGQPTPAGKEPTVAELQQLLAEIQRDLAQVTAQPATLKAISTATPYTAQGAEQTIKAAAEQVEPDLNPEQARSLQASLAEATTLLSGILDGARTVAQKAGQVGQAVKPIAEQLAPLVDKVGVAAFWVARLWLQSQG